MKNKITIFIFILLSWSMPGTAQNKTDIRGRFEQELKAKSTEIHSIVCKFIQIRSISVLSEEVKKPGNCYYTQPNNILLAFDDGDYIKMASNIFEMKNGSRITKTKMSVNPMLRNMSAMISACMTGDLKKITAGFSAEILQNDKEYIMHLTPQHKAAAKISCITLVFDRKDMSLSTLKMEESSGDYTCYKFSEKHFNTTIDTKLFNIQ